MLGLTFVYSILSAQKGSAAQQLGTGHRKRIREIEKPKVSVAALRKRPYMGSIEGSRSWWIRFTLVSGARRKVGRGSGRLGWRAAGVAVPVTFSPGSPNGRGQLCRSWGRHPSAITLDAGDSHLSWDSVRLMIYETVPYANQNDSSLDVWDVGCTSFCTR